VEVVLTLSAKIHKLSFRFLQDIRHAYHV